MGPEELKELINSTIQETRLWDSLLVSTIPVIFTLLANTFYDRSRRKQDFIKNYNIEQLKELYLPLYSVIVQSEYFKSINNQNIVNNNGYVTFFEFKTEREEYNSANVDCLIVKKEIETPVNKCNVDYLISLVIEKREFASPNLIKLAISLRFLSEKGDAILKDKSDLEQSRLISEFIKLIVKDTNRYLKYCKMEYCNYEIKDGLMRMIK